MALIEIKMPEMGESVLEATVISWLKKEGEKVEEEEPLLEVATDKVDTEVPSVYEGILKQILVKEGEVANIGSPIAIMMTDGEPIERASTPIKKTTDIPKGMNGDPKKQNADRPLKEDQSSNGLDQKQIERKEEKSSEPVPEVMSGASRGKTIPVVSDRFYSPLVRNIAKEEQISMDELNKIEGSGLEGRVTKNDILGYLQTREHDSSDQATEIAPKEQTPQITSDLINEEDEVVEMDRIRKLIAERMVESRKISAHVHSFVEADVTEIVKWKKRHENHFKDSLGVKLTYSPIFVEAIVKALKDYPMMNISVEGDKIIKKKRINIGMAVALMDGNLIVPVIKNADQLNLVGLARQVNDLARRARENQLSPHEITGSTYTMTNVGPYGSTMGTPIILQPNVGILAIGTIEKKVSVLETEEFGDVVTIRNKMTLSHSYDHRVIDGALGSMFVRRVADYLENFDVTRSF
jgi:2-oxoglutarate dehydrogenase E2 component (dihydrolipoamide succinyltransferase)